MAITQPIRNKDDISALVSFYRDRGQYRNYALIVLGLYTALRISDILRLLWDDVYDFENRRFRNTIDIVEKKTGKSKTIALNGDVVTALTLLAEHAACPGHSIIENAGTGKAISRVQAYRIVRAASESLQLEVRVSCHSLRKTFGYHAWKSGVSPVVIMDIYNHSSLAVTRRYLGVSQDDRNSVYLNLNLLDPAV